MSNNYTQLVEKAAVKQARLQLLVKRLQVLDDARELVVEPLKIVATKNTYGGETVSDSSPLSDKIKRIIREDIEAEICRLSSELAAMFGPPAIAAEKKIEPAEQPEPGNGEMYPGSRTVAPSAPPQVLPAGALAHAANMVG